MRAFPESFHAAYYKRMIGTGIAVRQKQLSRHNRRELSNISIVGLFRAFHN
jgi:hypothetical protein